MIHYILRFAMRFLAGFLIQQAVRFLAAMITRPPRRASAPEPRTPKKPKTTIDPKHIVEGRFEDIPEK